MGSELIAIRFPEICRESQILDLQMAESYLYQPSLLHKRRHSTQGKLIAFVTESVHAKLRPPALGSASVQCLVLVHIVEASMLCVFYTKIHETIGRSVCLCFLGHV